MEHNADLTASVLLSGTPFECDGKANKRVGEGKIKDKRKMKREN
jgi:hypothetical protein